jgi:hypothetical protein
VQQLQSSELNLPVSSRYSDILRLFSHWDGMTKKWDGMRGFELFRQTSHCAPKPLAFGGRTAKADQQTFENPLKSP